MPCMLSTSVRLGHFYFVTADTNSESTSATTRMYGQQTTSTTMPAPTTGRRRATTRTTTTTAATSYSVVVVVVVFPLLLLLLPLPLLLLLLRLPRPDHYDQRFRYNCYRLLCFTSFGLTCKLSSAGSWVQWHARICRSHLAGSLQFPRSQDIVHSAQVPNLEVAPTQEAMACRSLLKNLSNSPSRFARLIS